MKLPNKLIVVGMRFKDTKDVDFIRRKYSSYLRRDEVSIDLFREANSQGVDGFAYAVHIDGLNIGFIRNADLGALPKDRTSIRGAYRIGSFAANYIVLLKKEQADYTSCEKEAINELDCKEYVTEYMENPCAEIYMKNYANSHAEKFVTYSSNAASLGAYKNPETNLKEKPKMIDKMVAMNKRVATDAAFLETGRSANRQLTKLVGKKAPVLVRGYIDTPLGKLVVANVAAMAIEQFRGDDAKLAKLASYMVASAYQELIQTLDIDSLLDELTNSTGFKKALNSIED